jgi:hypothetical protein
MVTLRALAEANCLTDKIAAGDAADSLAEAIFGIGAGEVSSLFMIELIKSVKKLEDMDLSTGHEGQYLRARQG